jgi:hypothetical protein
MGERLHGNCGSKAHPAERQHAREGKKKLQQT